MPGAPRNPAAAASRGAWARTGRPRPTAAGAAGRRPPPPAWSELPSAGDLGGVRVERLARRRRHGRAAALAGGSASSAASFGRSRLPVHPPPGRLDRQRSVGAFTGRPSACTCASPGRRPPPPGRAGPAAARRCWPGARARCWRGTCPSRRRRAGRVSPPAGGAGRPPAARAPRGRAGAASVPVRRFSASDSACGGAARRLRQAGGLTWRRRGREQAAGEVRPLAARRYPPELGCCPAARGGRGAPLRVACGRARGVGVRGRRAGRLGRPGLRAGPRPRGRHHRGARPHRSGGDGPRIQADVAGTRPHPAPSRR